jgi:hypothetical protein
VPLGIDLPVWAEPVVNSSPQSALQPGVLTEQGAAGTAEFRYLDAVFKFGTRRYAGGVRIGHDVEEWSDHPEKWAGWKLRVEASYMAFRRRKHAARVTPMNEGNKPGSNVKRRPRHRPGETYQRTSYARAIRRACEAAFPAPKV